MFDFIRYKKEVLKPQQGSPWASEMVLNPAIIKDEETGRIHMLFRATGPWQHKRMPGKPLPFPIFLGYGWSDDDGATWGFDLDNPALAPALETDIDKIFIKDYMGRRVVNHANGCIEDPRLFRFENECYVITACRMFPPGPYWEHDEPTQCAPDWIKTGENPFGKAASDNVTVNVLFKVDLKSLANKEYDKAFTYIANLTDPRFGEDRDVVVFPERLNIDGKKMIVMLQRPFSPEAYKGVKKGTPPSIMICAANSFEDFSNPDLPRKLFASPEFGWEKDRIGASTPPLRISGREWLLNYHGKQDTTVGYTQSFMVLEEQESGFPIIRHRCPERVIIADQKWEQPNKFKTPCVFITGLIRIDNRLMASYGAADEKVGILEIDYPRLIDFLRKY